MSIRLRLRRSLCVLAVALATTSCHRPTPAAGAQQDANETLSVDSLMALLDNAPPDTALFRATFAEVEARLLAHHRFALDSVDLATLRYVDSIFFHSGPTLNYSSGSTGRSGGRMGRGGFNRMPTFAQIASATNASGRNRGFLGSAVTYGVERDLLRRNLVVPLVGNFAAPKTVRAVGD